MAVLSLSINLKFNFLAAFSRILFFRRRFELLFRKPVFIAVHIEIIDKLAAFGTFYIVQIFMGVKGVGIKLHCINRHI